MSKILGYVITYLLLTAASFAQAYAQQHNLTSNCSTREDVLAVVQGRYNEDLIVAGLGTNENGLIEFFGSNDGKTWSLVITSISSGTSCLVFSGYNVRVVENPALHILPDEAK